MADTSHHERPVDTSGWRIEPARPSGVLKKSKATSAHRNTVVAVNSDSGLRRDQFAARIVAQRDSERRGTGAVETVSWPDVDERQRPAVEFVGRDEHGLIAVEHTTIESYQLQITEQKALQAMFPLGGPEIAELPNAGQFHLLVRVDELRRVPHGERRRVEPAVAAWIRSVLPSVPWPHVPGKPTFVRGQIDHPPLEVSLERWIADVGFAGPLARVVSVGFWRPGDIEERRKARLEETLVRRLPKLLAAADGARTILVLEDRDMHMSAPGLVSRALASLQPVQLPDVIYLLNVTAGDPLLVPIYDSTQWWHDNNHGMLTFSTDAAARFNALHR